MAEPDRAANAKITFGAARARLPAGQRRATSFAAARRSRTRTQEHVENAAGAIAPGDCFKRQVRQKRADDSHGRGFGCADVYQKGDFIELKKDKRNWDKTASEVGWVDDPASIAGE